MIDAVAPGLFAAGNRAAANDVAAMPSLHTAIAAVVALYLPGSTRRRVLLGGEYVALMALALLGLGEHYLSDVLAGLLLALAVSWLVRRGFGRWGRQEVPGNRAGPAPSPESTPADRDRVFARLAATWSAQGGTGDCTMDRPRPDPDASPSSRAGRPRQPCGTPVGLPAQGEDRLGLAAVRPQRRPTDDVT